jgi:hypothetical protein
MTTLKGLALVLTAAAVGLAAAGGATGKTSTARAKLRHVNGRIEALAIDGNRIAYGVEPASTRNRVVVWNVRNGRTTKVSGSGTAQTGDSSTGSGLFGLGSPAHAWRGWPTSAATPRATTTSSPPR